MSTTLNVSLDISLDDIYTDIRLFLLTFVDCEVVQGFEQNVPMPTGDFVSMQILYAHPLATNIYEYDSDNLNVEVMQSTELSMQLDFYGVRAGEYARTFATLWQDFYGCRQLTKCQPLYADDPKLLPFINDASLYEQRWCVTAVMQYNPIVTHQEDFIDDIPVSLNLTDYKE